MYLLGVELIFYVYILDVGFSIGDVFYNYFYYFIIYFIKLY